MTYQEAFEKIKTTFADVDRSAFKGDFSAQITFNDSECGGTFYIQLKNDEFFVEPYDYQDNSVLVNISYNDFIKVLLGDESIITLLNCGQAVSEGNTAVLEDMNGSVKAPKAKTAAKKTTAKKTTAAKKTTTAKTTAAKPAAAKSTTAKTTAAKSTATKTTAAKSTAAKKTAAKAE